PRPTTFAGFRPASDAPSCVLLLDERANWRLSTTILSMSGGMAVETLESGREAIRKRDWDRALDALTEVDQDGGLSPDDLMLLGDAYWWSAKPDQAVDVFERAYEGFLDEDRLSEAAIVGAQLAYFAMRRMAVSVAIGWMARITRLLDGQPESPGHAWLEILHLAEALFVTGDLDAVIARADDAMGIAERQKTVAAQALAMSFKGIALTYKGEWREGVALIDEASILAMSRGDDLRASSDVYCNTIGVCSSLADYRRAGEWTEEAERWMKNNSVGGFTGVCQVHRAELKRLRGAWSEAEHDARIACVELERFHLLNGLGFANYEIGEVRRRMGDLEAAEEAFMRAYEYGHPAQPGLALLKMNQGKPDEAAASISAVLATTLSEASANDILTRGHLLPAQTEIAVAAGDFELARHAVAELEQIAEIYDSPTWHALALTCRGSVELGEGNAEEALRVLHEAWRIWQQIDLPYEAARARELLGRARLATGDETGAGLEFRAARSVYHKLGARTDLERLEDTSGGLGGAAPRERLTKAFMFTDIVTSTDLIGLIGDDAWERLLDWHDRELGEAITSHRGEEVRHTGDGLFVAFDSARDAIDCAVSIQRRLVEHRLQHGFSPTVRIGIHLAEATKQRDDYAGVGVHVAARVGDLGGGEEIVVSEPLLSAAGAIPYPVSEPREVELKGVSEPVMVYNVDWRS
ncbi:MAG: adenylate/guanylate cyclase domain-containing protein, partial [Acidimicrobiia bacterium]